jgi:hypothetical protein
MTPQNELTKQNIFDTALSDWAGRSGSPFCAIHS